MRGRPSTRKRIEIINFTIDLLNWHQKNNFDLRRTNAFLLTHYRTKTFERMHVKDIKKIRIGELLE